MENSYSEIGTSDGDSSCCKCRCRRPVSCRAVVYGCFQIWRSWIKPLVLTLYLAVLLIALPLMIIEFQTHETEVHVQAWFIGGLFVVMALPISLYGILQHLVHYTRPDLQRNIIR